MTTMAAVNREQSKMQLSCSAQPVAVELLVVQTLRRGQQRANNDSSARQEFLAPKNYQGQNGPANRIALERTTTAEKS